MKALFNRLTKLDVVVSVKESLFGQRKTKLLGFIVSGKGIGINPGMADEIPNMENPRTAAHILRFPNFELLRKVYSRLLNNHCLTRQMARVKS